jgi:bacterioferritin-associated ferredoxin
LPLNANHYHLTANLMYVCVCYGVTDKAIQRAADDGVREVTELTMRTGLGSNCGSCHEMAKEILSEAHARNRFPLPILQAA